MAMDTLTDSRCPLTGNIWEGLMWRRKRRVSGIRSYSRRLWRLTGMPAIYPRREWREERGRALK